MARIPLIDRKDMNADQARVYDAAKQSGGPTGGPYYAYIRLPKLFEAAQNMRATMGSGPLSRREQQIVNITVARYWNARYPWHAQVAASLKVGLEQSVIDEINARKIRLCRMRGRKPVSPWRARYWRTEVSPTRPMRPRKRAWAWKASWRWSRPPAASR